VARGNGPGKDFDDQWNESRRRAQEKARRGESHWAHDKYLERESERLGSSPAGHRGEPKGCADKTVMLLALIAGALWLLGEFASRVA
jgi:hypothetical protein